MPFSIKRPHNTQECIRRYGWGQYATTVGLIPSRVAHSLLLQGGAPVPCGASTQSECSNTRTDEVPRDAAHSAQRRKGVAMTRGFRLTVRWTRRSFSITLEPH